MGTFKVTGTITQSATKTSSKGNTYVVFTLKDHAGKVFDFSLFGESMEFAEHMTVKTPINVSGVLDSREYTDKNGATRYGISLKPTWIEPVETYTKAAATKTRAVTAEVVDMDSIPF